MSEEILVNTGDGLDPDWQFSCLKNLNSAGADESGLISVGTEDIAICAGTWKWQLFYEKGRSCAT